MKFLRIFHKKNIVAEQTAQLQLKESNGFKALRSLSSYSLLIILIGILLIGGCWLLTWQQINYDYDRTIQETSLETMNLSIAFEEHVRRIIADADKDLLNLKEAYEQDGISSPGFSAYAHNAEKDPARDRIAVYNERGDVIVSFIRASIGLNSSDRDYFQVHKSSTSQELDIGRTILGRAISKQIIPLTRRINKPDGSFGGIVYIGLKVDYFLSFYQKIELGQQRLISLTGRDGFNRARRSGDNFESGQDHRNSEMWRRIQAKSSFASYLSTNIYDGVARVTSYRAMAEYPLIVSVGKSAQVALASYEQRKQNYILGSTLVSLLIVAICGFLIDRMRQVIGESDKRYESLVTAMPDGFAYCKMIYENDEPEDLIYLATNDAFTKLTGLENAVGKRITELIPGIKESNPELLKIYGRVAKSGQSERFENYYEPLKAWLLIAVSSHGDGNFMVIFDNITERKLMEEELKKHRENLQVLVAEQVRDINKINSEMAVILDSISYPFYVLDKEWRFTYINKEAMQMNIRMEKMHVGQNIWELYPELIGGELYQKCHETCATKTPIHTIYKSIFHEKNYEIHLHPYPDGLFVYFRDVTEQKRYEAEMSRLDRLNIIGEMAASIGHEVRNPMTTVRGYLQWFGQKAAFVDYREQLTVMIEELDRANTIITEFLSLAKDKNINLESTNLNIIIQGIWPLLQADAFRRGNTIELALGDTPKVFADDNEIRQCILNLVANGLDAMPEGGKLTISTVKSESQVIMTVRDSGSGIPLEIIEKLWVPFFTTKEHGTGLGLSVCYQIAQRHGATIEVETSPKGTAFHFIFSQKKKDSE